MSSYHPTIKKATSYNLGSPGSGVSVPSAPPKVLGGVRTWKFRGVAVYAPSSLPWGKRIVGGWVGRGSSPYGSQFRKGPKANPILPSSEIPQIRPAVVRRLPPPIMYQ